MSWAGSERKSCSNRRVGTAHPNFLFAIRIGTRGCDGQDVPILPAVGGMVFGLVPGLAVGIAAALAAGFASENAGVGILIGLLLILLGGQ